MSSTQTLTSRPNGRTITPYGALTRREKALQADIQELLNAQSSELLRGQAPDTQGAASASYSPSTRAFSTKPGIRSLRSARLGILRALHTLLEFSQTKHTILLDTHASLVSTLQQVARWQRKLAEVEKKITALEATDPEAQSLDSLSREQDAVEREIRQLEERLHELKIRRRILARQAVEQRSRREAQSSSWIGAKQEIENEVSKWLRHPPASMFVEHDLLVGPEAEEVEALLQTFIALPPKRRTLDMAQDWLKAAVGQVESQVAAAEREGEASERGAVLWEEVLERILTFEADLRAWMKKQAAGSKTASSPEKLLGRMRDIGKELEGYAETAEHEGWNLLVCAIGAELEAWREGEEVLSGVLGQKPNNEETTRKSEVENNDTNEGRKNSSFNESMGSDGADMWGSALDAPALDNEETLDNSRRGRQENSISRPRSKSQSRSSAHSIELEGLKLSGGTPRRSSPIDDRLSRNPPAEKDSERCHDGRDSEEEDDGPDPALMFSADAEGDD